MSTGEFSNDADRMTRLVDSGGTGRYFDNEVHPSLKDKLLIYKKHKRPHKTVTAGRHDLLETATGTVSGAVTDMDDNKHPRIYII